MEELDVTSFISNLGLGDIPNIDQAPVYDFISYLKAINWSEPWLSALVCLHVTLFILIIVTRNRIPVQIVILLSLLGTVGLSERINKFAAENWRMFAEEQYFDCKGMFISIVMSAPMLLNSLLIVINFLLQNCYMLRDIQELKSRKMSEAKKKEKKDS